MTDELPPYTVRIAIGALLGAIFVLALPSVRLIWFDPRDYYTYQGVAGPFEVVEDNGTEHAGKPISTVRQGGRFAWVSTLCLGEGVSASASVELREVQSKIVVSHQNFEITPPDKRCGPKMFVMQVPADAPPGLYEAERKDLFEPPNGWPASAVLPPIDIEVTAK